MKPAKQQPQVKTSAEEEHRRRFCGRLCAIFWQPTNVASDCGGASRFARGAETEREIVLAPPPIAENSMR